MWNCRVEEKGINISIYGTCCLMFFKDCLLIYISINSICEYNMVYWQILHPLQSTERKSYYVIAFTCVLRFISDSTPFFLFLGYSHAFYCRNASTGQSLFSLIYIQFLLTTEYHTCSISSAYPIWLNSGCEIFFSFGIFNFYY
jgi:hypothetical protein